MPITLPVKTNTKQVHRGSDLKVFYPQVYGMQNRRLEGIINRRIVQKTQELIDMQVGEMPSTIVEMLGSYEVKNNQREVLSFTFSNYTYHHHAAHGMTYINSLTFDLQSGKECTLKELFKPDSPYVRRLSELIQEQIVEREIPLLEEFTEIKPN